MIAGAAGLVTGLFKSAPAAALEAAGADETASQSKAIDTFAVHLTVAPIRNSRLVDVKFRSADAALATAIVNALAQNYIDQTLEYKFSANKDANDWLGGQLAEQRKQVEAAEAKLQAYREQNDAISLEDRQNIVVQKLTDLNSAVTRAKTERIQKEAMCDAAARASRTIPRRSTRSRRFSATPSSSSRRASWRSCSSRARSCRRSSARSTRRSSRTGRRFRVRS